MIGECAEDTERTGDEGQELVECEESGGAVESKVTQVAAMSVIISSSAPIL